MGSEPEVSLKALAVVMPVYNEEEALPSVLLEWKVALERLGVNYCFLAWNDGSTDSSEQVLQEHQKTWPQLEIQSRRNRGHGQSCLSAYRWACREGFDYILQIDSDGQCDPKYLPQFWELRGPNTAIMGRRKTRDDGRRRWLISRLVSGTVLLSSGRWLKDANVPYRLMSRKQLEPLLKVAPRDFYLANVWVAIMLKKRSKIQWIDIHFRDRVGGSPSLKSLSYAQQGLRLIYEIWKS